ncbi:MAG TPA: phosphoribosylformylglycinamidine cyclo-ligase [Gemmatimonadota bacterium]|nr:phosphoribosylformylglycinamidine cyclo-ligase [Gemmatimonadota bacterium]
MTEPGDAPAYRASGVDLSAADRFKARLKDLVGATHGPEVLGGLGGFGGCFAIEDLAEADPVLVASADGVGTKVLVAQAAGRHDTVGEDLVNHCVDDLLASGARPLFFLDYLALGRLEEDVAVALVEGFARGCRENGIALLGGETAEMPDAYAPGTYDLAGFAVGVAPRARLETWNRRGRPGDVVLGLESTGLHTNGYTLARRTMETSGRSLEKAAPWGGGTFADHLLAVHRSYLSAVGPLLNDPALHGVAHVTGGGFEGNLPRALPDGVAARIDRAAWTPGPLFEWLAEASGASADEMYRVFNMGIGLALFVEAAEADRVAAACAAAGAPATCIGELVEGTGVVWA